MATVQLRGKYWSAKWRDSSGKQHCRSTGETNRKTAQKIADAWEDVSRKDGSIKQQYRVLGDMLAARGAFISVEGYVKDWLAGKGHVEPATRDFYQNSTAKFLVFLGPRAAQPLSSLSKPDLLSYREWLLVDNSLNNAQRHFKLITALFRSACEDDVLDKNPAQFIKPLKREKTQKRRPFTYDEVLTVLAQAESEAGSEWPSMILLGYHTGQRLMDLACLKWNNIELATGFIRFATQKTGKEMVIALKDPSGNLNELGLHIAGMVRPIDSDAFIHPLSAQTPEAQLSTQFLTLLYRAGLIAQAPWARKRSPDAKKNTRPNRSELSFHCFRHTAVSEMKLAGIAQSTVMAAVGHDSQAVNALYTHVPEEELVKAAASRKPLRSVA
jgi:integrase